MKNFILKAITVINLFIMVMGICMIDSESLLPTAFIVFPLFWVLPFIIINRECIFTEDLL